MGIYSKAVRKNKTVDALVNERERTRARRECLSQDTCVWGEVPERPDTRRELEHMKVIKKECKEKGISKKWHRSMGKREKKRTTGEEQEAGKRRSWRALWQLCSIPRRITRAVDATNCQQEASSLGVHGRNTGTPHGHMRDFSQLYPPFLSTLSWLEILLKVLLGQSPQNRETRINKEEKVRVPSAGTPYPSTLYSVRELSLIFGCS